MAHFSYAGNATANKALNQTIKILKAITCQTNKTIKKVAFFYMSRDFPFASLMNLK